MVRRSGDILVMDEEGWLYFQDRKGDTFRSEVSLAQYAGENCTQPMSASFESGPSPPGRSGPLIRLALILTKYNIL
jgi:hypothetical protein